MANKLLMLMGVALFTGAIAPSWTGTLLAQKDDANVQFKWAFGVLAGGGENRRYAPITRDTVLRTGDQLKMFVELKKECYVYVIHHGPEGEVTLLFPYEMKQFATDYSVGKNYYVPKGRYLLALDNTDGKETIYLLASVRRLTEVEDRLQKYMAAGDSKRTELANDVLAAMRDVRKQYKTFATLAERPISVGGNVRGGAEADPGRLDVASIAVEVSAANFYSKTFSIDHR